MLRFILGIFILLNASLVYAKEALNPLPFDKAFQLTVSLDQNREVHFNWHLAKGDYLYRNKISITPTANNQVSLGDIILPKGRVEHDVLHGQFEAYFDAVTVTVPLRSGKGIFNVNVNYQGCSSAGFCYAPMKKTLLIDMSKRVMQEDLTAYVRDAGVSLRPMDRSAPDNVVQKIFAGHNFFVTLLSFLGIGVLLAFTPCTLPMVPILSGIIIGHGKQTGKKKAFFLSLAYVAGMAITYAIVGVVIALIGSSIQVQLQKPWVIVLFSGIFILLAMSLFGLYELQLPGRWQQWVAGWSNRQKGGTYAGVFFMGSLSTLIVSPCVSAPLVGVLAYIGQTGNIWLGASTLLALGVGMGIPLLAIGLSADRLLPKAGAWMATVERMFGLLMLGVAIWMLSRMIPGPITLFLWALLSASSAVYFMLFALAPPRLTLLVKGAGVIALLYSIILTIGAVSGNSDPLHPWEQFNFFEKQSASHFTVIHSMDDLTEQLQKGKPVMLDFYADWCASCVVMDRRVFSKTVVQTALQPFIVLRADMTQNNDFDQALEKRFNIVGPPGTIFFNREGEELTSLRIVGEVNSKEFLAQLEKVEHGLK